MFFCTHVEDQSLRGPLLKALEPVCRDHRGLGAPHPTDIKRMGEWGGHLSHLHQLWHIFIEHPTIDDELKLQSTQKAPGLRRPLTRVWEDSELADLAVHVKQFSSTVPPLS